MSSELKSTTVQTNSLKDKTGTRTLASDSGSAWSWGANVPVGTVLQVVNVPFNDQVAQSGATPTDVKEFDALTITNGSKLLIQLNCSIGGNYNTRLRYLVKTASDGSYATLSSASGIGTNTLTAQSGSDSATADEILVSHRHATGQYGQEMTSTCHVIGPITSTYFRLKLQIYSTSSESASINRRTNDTTAGGRSYMTFMEIAQ